MSGDVADVRPKIVLEERHDQPEDRPDAEDDEPDHDIEPNRLPCLDSSILFPLASLIKPFDQLLNRLGTSAMWALLSSTRYHPKADPEWDCHIALFYRPVRIDKRRYG